MNKHALFDPTQRYRYTLTREWEPSLGRACFVMLNPSTADALQDDPTIRRCISFTTRWGMGSLEVVNLFAFRATNPMHLPIVDDPIGPENDEHIKDAVARATVIVAAWGAYGCLFARENVVRLWLPNAKCLGTTAHGFPRHPLRVRSDKALEEFER